MKAGNVQADMVDSVVVGNVLTAAASDCPYVARHTALRSGLRLETPANTVNRLCGSGFQVTFVNIYMQYFCSSKIFELGGFHHHNDKITQ